MRYYDIVFIILFSTPLIIFSLMLGKHMALVYEGKRNFLSPVLRPVELLIYRVCGISETEEMTWRRYAWAFAIFNLIGIAFLFALQVAQGLLPFNPQGLPGVRWDTALNTAVSFVTNTNWQSYSGETTMSYLTQMLGLTVQNFLSAGIGMAVALPLIRGFIRKETNSVGNMWVDLTRSVLYILLPLSIVMSLLLMANGVVQTLHSYIVAHTLEGPKQVIAVGPAASQIAIKQLGSNGGGFFNANSAHPFENPTFFTDLVENLAILLIPISSVFMFGFMIKKSKQAVALFVVMLILFVVGLGVILNAEYKPNPALAKIGLGSAYPINFNMEGKETRFGVSWSGLWSESTTATSNGSVDSMHDSFMPLSGMVQMFNMGVGEVIFGGVGVGLIGMLFYVILSMFVAGLMIGRTPEYLGKKLGPHEMIMAMISMLLPMMSLVIFSAIAVLTKTGLASLNNPSSHGLSEILYAFTSGHGNNGSAFAGLNANTVFYNCTLAATMLIGRFATIIPALAVGGSLAMKKTLPESSATFPTTGITFIIVVVSVIVIMGALTFFPVYSLGPILEHLFLNELKLL